MVNLHKIKLVNSGTQSLNFASLQHVFFSFAAISLFVFVSIFLISSPQSARADEVLEKQWFQEISVSGDPVASFSMAVSEEAAKAFADCIMDPPTYEEYQNCVFVVSETVGLVGNCDGTVDNGNRLCVGPIPKNGGIIEYTIYSMLPDTNSPECFVSTNGLGGGVCPAILTASGTASVDMAGFGVTSKPKVSQTPPQEAQINTESTKDSKAVNNSSEDGWNTPSILSALQPLSLSKDLWTKLASSTALAFVLMVIFMWPSQIINKALEESEPLFAPFKNKLKATRFITWIDKSTTFLRKSKAILILSTLFLSTFISGLADPDFGINAGSLRYLITVLTGFILINLLGTFLVWKIQNSRGVESQLVIQIKFSYVFLLIGTVLVTRAFQLEPPVIFGALIAVEVTRVLSALRSENAEIITIGKFQLASNIVMLVIGFSAWLGYSFLAFQGTGEVSIFVTELLATLAIEALATLPIILLPLNGLPGGLIRQWKKSIWWMLYLVSLALFILVIVPLPQSWDGIAYPFITWASIFVAYLISAIVFWKLVERKARKSP